MRNKKPDNKTIGITVYFFANDLPEKIGDKTPFRTQGSVCLKVNKTKDIKKQEEAIFKSFEGILPAIKLVLAKGNLVAVEKGKK